MDIVDWLSKEDEMSTPTVKEEKIVTASKPAPRSISLTGTSFEIDRDIFLYLLEKASAALPKGASIVPLLENFQLIVRKDLLTVIATNMEIMVSITTKNVDVITEGEEAIPAKKLLAIVKESEGAKVFLETTPEGAAIVIGNSSWELQQPKSKDFPKVPSSNEMDVQDVDREMFINALSKVKYAIAKDQTRPQLKMVNIKAGKFMAFDSLRFQMARMDELELPIQVPGYCIDTLLKSLKSSNSEKVKIGLGDKRLLFETDNEQLFISKLTATYPNVETLVLRPALSNDIELKVDKELFRKAIKRVKILADEQSQAIALSLSRNKMEVMAKDVDGNRATEELDVKYFGKKRTLVVNYAHLQDLLRAYDPVECRFLLGEDSKTRKSTLLLKDDESGALGFITQLHAAVLR